MKRTLVYCFVALLFPALFAAQPKMLKIQPVKSDLLTNEASSFIQMNGYLGGKIDLCVNQRIKKQDVAELIEPFRHRKETRLWQTEFWGKWVLSAIGAYQYNHDSELFTAIQKSAIELMATQTPDGYIGNYAPESQLQQWDIWGRKYTLLGLLAYYDISKDKKALDAACKSANYLLSQVGPTGTNIVKTGNFRGMASCSVLEPIVLLYNHTGDKRYLDFAKYIVSQWETADGPKLISKALDGVAVFNRFPLPKEWWSWDNGQKAYEMMSCYEGLLELYRITGETTYLKATEMTVQNIIENEINVAGSGTAFECFYNGSKRQTEPAYHTMETCVSVTWIKLCNNLLRLTGNPMYADQIEKTVYNALLASMKDDGSEIAKYSPLEGRRSEGGGQCGMHIHCCNANGPRAFVLIPKIAIQSSPNEIFVNLYSQSSSILTINKKNKVTVEQKTTYPESNEIEITLQPEKPENFSLNLRIPAWSNLTAILVNGETVA
ncbi:MAG: beta-L-arabinofuranosidase domain-containing protein, partial [Paludibacter sp.]